MKTGAVPRTRGSGLRVTLGVTLGAALGNRDPGRTQHAIADHITGLDHLGDRSGRHRRIGYFEQRLVQVGIELGALRLELSHAMLVQRLEQFALGELHALDKGLGGAVHDGPAVARGFQRPAHIVDHADQVLGKASDGIGARLRGFALGTAAQVFHVGERAEQPVLQLRHLLGERCRLDGGRGRGDVVRGCRGIVVVGGRVRHGASSWNNLIIRTAFERERPAGEGDPARRPPPHIDILMRKSSAEGSA